MHFQHIISGIGLLGCLSIASISLAESSEDPIELDTVQVETNAEPLTEISTKKLLKVPGAGNDPLRAIESLPGVVFSNSNSSAPAIRGSSPEDNRYLSDFLPVGYIFHSDSSSILSDNVVEHFNLEKAAFASQYNNATGAILESTSRKPYTDKSQYIIDVSFFKAGLFAEDQVSDNQSFYLSARQSLFQYYIKHFLDDKDFELVQVPEYYDYQGRYQIRLDDQEDISLHIHGARDHAKIDFPEDSNLVKQEPILKGGLRERAYFNSQGILWDKIYGSGLEQKTGFSQLEELFNFGLGKNEYTIKSNTYTLRSQFSYPVNYKHDLKWGLEYRAVHMRYNLYFKIPACDEFKPDCRFRETDKLFDGKGKPVVHNYHVNLADQWQVTPDWEFTTGVVLSTDSYTKQKFIEPRLRSRWNFANDWWFNSAYGRHHIFQDDFSVYTKELGNRELKQSKSTHYEVGLENKIDDSLFWKVDAYFKNMDSLIVSKPDKKDAFPNLTDSEYDALPLYTNDVTGKAWGVELFVNKTLSENWYGWLSFAYSRTQRTNELTNLRFRYAFDQPVVINTVINYKLDENWEMGIRWRLMSGQLVTPLIGAKPTPTKENPDLHEPIYSKRINSERLPLNHKMDLRFARTFHYTSWEMDFYFEVQNAYKRHNIIDYDYEGADYSKKLEIEDLPGMAALGVKVKL